MGTILIELELLDAFRQRFYQRIGKSYRWLKIQVFDDELLVFSIRFAVHAPNQFIPPKYWQRKVSVLSFGFWDITFDQIVEVEKALGPGSIND